MKRPLFLLVAALLAAAPPLSAQTILRCRTPGGSLGDCPQPVAQAYIPSSIPATKVSPGTVSDTVFGYLAGVTSSIQTQLNAIVAAAVALSNSTPAAVGSASAGVAATASRSDHVHALPAVGPGAGAIAYPASITLDAQGRVTAASGGSAPAPATRLVSTGTGLQGGGDLSADRTLSIDSTVATLTGAQALTNKTLSGSSNTFSNIGNSALTNSAITIGVGSGLTGGGSVSLGGTSTALAIDGTVATLTGSQTLTNKTLTAPIINGAVTGTITVPTPGAGTSQPATAAYAEAQKTGSVVVLGTASQTTGIWTANYYIGPYGIVEGALLGITSLPVPACFSVAGTLKNFRLQAQVTNSPATNVTVYQTSAGAPSYSATAAVIPVANNAQVGSDTTHSLSIAAGDCVVDRTDTSWVQSGVVITAQFVPTT